MTEWEPATEAEAAMRDALRMSDQELYFQILARTVLLLPVSADALAGRTAMGWGTWSSGGRTHALSFTSPEALRLCLAEHAGSARRISFIDLAKTWPNQEWWLAVNPGLPIEGYLPSWFVSQLARGDARLPGRITDGREVTQRVPSPPRLTAAPNPLGPGVVPASQAGETDRNTDMPRDVYSTATRAASERPTDPLVASLGPPREAVGQAARATGAATVRGSTSASPHDVQSPGLQTTRPAFGPGGPAAVVMGAAANATTQVVGGSAGLAAGFAAGASAGHARTGTYAPDQHAGGRPDGQPQGMGMRPDGHTGAGLHVDARAAGASPAGPPAERPGSATARAATAAQTVGARAAAARAWQMATADQAAPIEPDDVLDAESTSHATAAAEDPLASGGAITDASARGRRRRFESIIDATVIDAEIIESTVLGAWAMDAMVVDATVVDGERVIDLDIIDATVIDDRVSRADRTGGVTGALGARRRAAYVPDGDDAAQSATGFSPDAAGHAGANAVGAAHSAARGATGGLRDAEADGRVAPGPAEAAPATAAADTAHAQPGNSGGAPAGTDRDGTPVSTVSASGGPSGPSSPAAPSGASLPGAGDADAAVVTAPAASSRAGTPAAASSADGGPSEGVPSGGARSSGAPSGGTPSGGTPASGPPKTPFSPANEVESDLLAAATSGKTDNFLSTLLLAKVLIPIPTGESPEVHLDDPTFPWRREVVEGQAYLVVFTSPERMTEFMGDGVVAVTARFVQLIRVWPDVNWAFAVNPGSPVGATLPGAQVKALAAWAADVGLTADDLPDDAPEPPEPTAAPTPATIIMQKPIAPSQVDYYLERGYDRASGFVHRAAEVAHLHTPEQIYATLGLSYSGSPFSRDATDIYVLRWAAYRGDLYRIPYGGQHEAAMRAMQGWMIERAPFRGNGFAPAEHGEVIAEFKVDSVRLPHGAQMWRLTSTGDRRLVAVLDADECAWRAAIDVGIAADWDPSVPARPIPPREPRAIAAARAIGPSRQPIDPTEDPLDPRWRGATSRRSGNRTASGVGDR